ncbi:MAG: RNA polymerase sigma factor [Candidatus Glassbacteria bacterium]|nr:RNA polymerase sigma factor [Candidatus Glassbacteria bacterium]
MQTDKQLVDEILAGRTEKFGVLAERYQQQIYRFLRGMSLDHDEAADVLQSALIRAYEKLDTLRGGERFRIWLYSIAANQARNYLRRERRSLSLEAVVLSAEEADLDGELDRGRVKELVAGALESLSAEQRRVVLLRIYEEMPFRDVAQSCGISLSNAKVTFHRAMKTLGRWLAPAAERMNLDLER